MASQTRTGRSFRIREAIMTLETQSERMLHVRFQGQSRDLRLAELDLGPLPSDQEVKQALARRLDVSVEKLRDYVVDRNPSGNLTVRPEAVFG